MTKLESVREALELQARINQLISEIESTFPIGDIAASFERAQYSTILEDTKRAERALRRRLRALEKGRSST